MINKIQKISSVGVIPAAGEGTRLDELPLTRVLPKPMLPILNRPILEHIIAEMRESGIKKIYIAVAYKKQIIQEYFGDGKDFGVDIEYLEHPHPENIGGIADTIYLAKNKIKEPFLTILGDDFTANRDPLMVLFKFFFEKQAIALEAVVREKNKDILRQTCMAFIRKDKIVKLVEKPSNPTSPWRGCGIYIFDPQIFSYIEKTPPNPSKGGRDITTTIDLVAQDGKAFAYKIKGRNININTLSNLIEAQKFALRRRQLLTTKTRS